MARCEFPVSWRFKAEDVDHINKLCNLFSDCRLVLEVVNSNIVFDYEVGVPKQPILFLGFTVDLVDGTFYYGRIKGTNAVRIGNINDLMRHFVNGPVSREVALMGVEKFKLTGSLKKMFEAMEAYSDGSMISVTVNSKVGESIQRKIQRVEDFYEKVIPQFNSKMNTLLRHVRRNISDESKVTFNRDLKSVIDMTSFEYNVTKTEEEMLLSCSPSAYHRAGFEDKPSKQAILASNLLDICDSVDGAEDVVLTTDLKGRLKHLGVDTLLTSRELSSVTANPAYVRMLKNSSEHDTDLTHLKLRDVGNWGVSMTSNVAYVARNSLKMLSKIVAKIKAIKEG